MSVHLSLARHRFNASTSIQNDMGDSPIHCAWRFWDRASEKLPVELGGDLEEDKAKVLKKVEEMETRASRKLEQEKVRSSHILFLLKARVVLTHRRPRSQF